MPEEPFALSTIPTPPPAEGDYDAICATVMESARGRWFLDEYARRNRNADTRLVLAAIKRIETVIGGERGQQAYQSFRTDLQEMATAIAQTRAEVAESRPQPQAQSKARPGNVTEPDTTAAPTGPDIFAAAERIQDIVWTMRERGLDPATCEQIEALATSILSVSSLRDPNDHRIRKLSEVLQYLERRIGTMLETCAEAAQAAAADDAVPDVVSDSYPLHGDRRHDADAGRTVADISSEANVESILAGDGEASAVDGTSPDIASELRSDAPAPPPAATAVELPTTAGGEEPSAALPAEAPAETVETFAEAQPALEASATIASETVELEIEPLVMTPIGRHEVVAADRPAAQLELDPIMVEPLFPPSGFDAIAPSGTPAVEASQYVSAIEVAPAGDPPDHPPELVAELVRAGPGVPAGEITLFFEEPAPASEPSSAASIPEPAVAAEAELDVPAASAAPTKAQGEVAEREPALVVADVGPPTAETVPSADAPEPEPQIEAPPAAEPAEVQPAAAAIDARPASEVAAEIQTQIPAEAMSLAPASPVDPAKETVVLSAAWETAMARSEAGETASPPPAEPPATMSAAEPADFLLEPLPLPDASSAPMQSDPVAAAQPPAESSVDAIMEIEEELFVLVPEDTARDAPVEQPPLQPEPPPEPTPQPAAPAATIVVATPEQIPVATAAVTAPTIAIAPSVAPSHPIAKPMPRPAPSDPLAALRAMSDEERIALFS